MAQQAKKKKAPRTRAVSTDTGLWWPCPGLGLMHRKRYAVPLRKGPKAFFAKCPICYSSTFFGRTWEEGWGMTATEARAQGYELLGAGV